MRISAPHLSSEHRRPRPQHRRSRLGSVAVGAAVAVALPLAAAGAAGAAVVHHPSTTPHQTVRHHYEADHMGSGVAARTPAASRVSVLAARALGGVPGMDVSGYQQDVDWPAAYAAGARFAVVKATEGVGYTNAYFAQQYNGSAGVGMVRGAYHFALPNTSTGTVQADYFVDNGGGWSADGHTLPPSLDIEYNPYGPTCYRLSPTSMVAWIHAFVDEVHARTGRYPMIYTTLDWWTRCTGNSAAFTADPLWLARYSASPGTMPAGWTFQTVWQYQADGTLPGDQDSFNGSTTQLTRLAGAATPVVAAVSAALPSKISVGSRVTRIPVTVATRDPQSTVTVALQSTRTGRVGATATFTSATPTTRFRGTVSLAVARTVSWGVQRWVVTAPAASATVRVGAVMRARSVVGFHTARVGKTLYVTGATRVFDAATGRYRAWTGRGVAVQRWTGSTWSTVRTVRTDGRGNLVRVRVQVAAGHLVRLTVTSGAAVWGATSASRVV